MNSDILIQVEGVRKKFCRSLKKSLWYGLKDMATEVTGGAGNHDQLRPGEFWAVNDISFQLRRGECLGLIGHNGAGKTTLLKMLNGLIKPDKGCITMRGKIGALIALGAGFNPILTGRENIYVNGSVLGLSKQQIDAKLDEILAFAEIEEFIDAPVQSYSSGMNVRLGFAVAVILIEPDILFLDEVLAVGDIGFTIKCLNAVRHLSQNAAVIFVSHSMQFVSAFCTRVIVMERGNVLMDAANPADGIDRYYAMVKLEKQQSGTGHARILSLTMRDNSGRAATDLEPRIEQGQCVSVDLEFELQEPCRGARVNLFIMDESMGAVMCLPLLNPGGEGFVAAPGRHCLNVPLGVIELNAGKYSFTVTIADEESRILLARLQGLLAFRVFSAKMHWGKIVRPVLALPRLADSQ